MDLLSIQNLSKTYHTKNREKRVLDGFELSMEKGELVALMGPSGTGKTTLLNLISGIDEADEGTILLEGEDISKLPRKEQVQYRRTKIGLVFQDYHLIDSLDVTDNIILPMTLEGKEEDEIEKRLKELLQQRELTDIANQYPATLSGGEKQRVAIARALANEPALLLADEPTGNLDVAATETVMQDFLEIREHSSILMVTHDAYAASFCTRVVFFSKGKIQKQLYSDGDKQRFFSQILSEMSQMGGRLA